MTSCCWGDATYDEVIGNLRAMAFAGWQPDQLTLYFSGHGNGAGIALADKVLPYQELGYWLGNIGARIKVLILDTCHAGSAARIFNERVAVRGRSAGRRMGPGP